MGRLIDADEAVKGITRYGDNTYRKIMDGADDPGEEFFSGLACAASVIQQAPTIYPELRWHLVMDGDGEMPPVDEEGYSDYVLVCFSNASFINIGQYRVDDGGGAFYSGDYDDPYTKYGLFVEAWMPLPKPWKEGKDEHDK